jgi:hypothetical protein
MNIEHSTAGSRLGRALPALAQSHTPEDRPKVRPSAPSERPRRNKQTQFTARQNRPKLFFFNGLQQNRPPAGSKKQTQSNPIGDAILIQPLALSVAPAESNGAAQRSRMDLAGVLGPVERIQPAQPLIYPSTHRLIYPSVTNKPNFAGPNMTLTVFMKGICATSGRLAWVKNKPKQTQFPCGNRGLVRSEPQRGLYLSPLSPGSLAFTATRARIEWGVSARSRPMGNEKAASLGPRECQWEPK